MFDCDNDPEYLQARLEAFIDHWHGYRKPWYGIAPEKLEQCRLPQPLKWLYGFAGEWPGNFYWDTLLGNQDCLIHFEDLAIRDEKLVFVSENQGVWQVGTDPDGTDPAVWASLDNGPWVQFEASLTRFIVTFVLHETVFGCQHLASGEGMTERLSAHGMQVVPLWLNHPYPSFGNDFAARPNSYHVANARYIVMDDYWCGTNQESPWAKLPSLFKPEKPSEKTAGLDIWTPIPDHVALPKMIRRHHLDNLVRKHEREVKFHEGRVALYSKMLSDLDPESAS